jgi:hypothetical protein
MLQELSRPGPEGLFPLRRVNAIQADLIWSPVVHHVAVNDAHNASREGFSKAPQAENQPAGGQPRGGGQA